MADYKLTHPLYLDTQMMYSFLAFLEGGISLEDEQTSTTSKTDDKEGRGSAKAKFPSIPHLFGAELALEGSLANKLESTTEYKVARHRTEASLFNYLYSRLHAESMIKVVDENGDLEGVSTGELIEVSGRYEGNPLSEILRLVALFYSYVGSGQEDSPKSTTAKNPRKSGNPQVRNMASLTDSPPSNGFNAEDFGVRMMLQMNQELRESPVHDVVVTTFGGLKTVLTVASEYFSETGQEFVREGEIKVLGKLTRALPLNKQINLMRRTIMGVAGEELARDVVKNFANTNTGMNMNPSDPIVAGPAAQILPMAIFV